MSRTGPGGRRGGRGAGAPSLRQVLPAIVLAVALVGTVVAFAVVGQPSSSAQPEVFGGSLLVRYTGRDPVVVDLAARRATLRLEGIRSAVGAASEDQVAFLPTDVGTFLVNRVDGSYNLLGRDNLLVVRRGGVALPEPDGEVRVRAVTTDDALYVVRSSATSSDVWLLDEGTVRSGAAGTTADPVGALALDVGVAGLDGEDPARRGTIVATAAGDLWLVDATDTLVRLSPRAEGGELARQDVRPVPEGAVLAARHDGSVVVVVPGEAQVLVARAGAAATPATTAIGADGSAPAPVEVEEHAVPALGDARSVVVAGGDREVAWFAIAGDDGPALVGVGDDGAVSGPHGLDGLGGERGIATPWIAGHRAVVVDRADGVAHRVDLVDGAVEPFADGEAYPIDPEEGLGPDDLTGIELGGAGRRVVVNLPDAVHAVVLDTEDGTSRPIDKSTALTVDPAAAPSPAIEADDAGEDPDEPAEPTEPDEAPLEQRTEPDRISEEATCADLRQVPRKPQLLTLEPTKDSMVLTWRYPKLDPADCQPSSYLVEARGVEGADDPPDPVRAHASATTQVRFDRLTPNRTYEFRVTAVIGENRTTSDPMRRRTDVGGPDAPSSVTTNADAPGGWVVSWSACDGGACEVPPVAFEVAMQPCGGGFVGPQEPIVGIPGRQRELAVSLADRPDLVGRSLSFTVTAISERGERAATSDGACTEGWRAPAADRVVVDVEGHAVDDRTAAAMVSVAATPNRAEVFGTSRPSFVYRVGPRQVGPTEALEATVDGLPLGVPQEVTVEVISHGEARTTEPTTLPATYLPWPEVRVTSRIEVHQGDRNRGTAVVEVRGVSPGEVTARAVIDCAGLRATHEGGLGGDGTLRWDVDLVTGIGPDCATRVDLRQKANVPRFTPSALEGLPAGQIRVPRLTPPELELAWDTEWRLFQERVVVRIEGEIPRDAGDRWRLVPTAGCEWSQIDLPQGNLRRFTIPGECVDDRGRIILAWRYLATGESVTLVVPGDRPTPTTTTTTTSTTTSTTTTSTTTPSSTTSTTAQAGGDVRPRDATATDGSSPVASVTDGPAGAAPDRRTAGVGGPSLVLVAIAAVPALLVRRRQRSRP